MTVKIGIRLEQNIAKAKSPTIATSSGSTQLKVDFPTWISPPVGLSLEITLIQLLSLSGVRFRLTEQVGHLQDTSGDESTRSVHPREAQERSKRLDIRRNCACLDPAINIDR
ncbi:hypothetical protein CHS0354_011412 [Potamilus streckersoni]|uniref:Uncharacterized protein n=1 Tax=Potamilus streckersoni TaxID=2493646 RepID=A0AAE0WCL7_9BIVA|nr:hypothetical protein CHS0354_011412 [Potamilus streckersoni]